MAERTPAWGFPLVKKKCWILHSMRPLTIDLGPALRLGIVVRKGKQKSTLFPCLIMEGPLPVPFWKETVCHVRWSPSCPRMAFVSVLLSSPPSPTELGPFLHKDPPSPLYIIQPSYLGRNPVFVCDAPGILHMRAASCCCVTAAIMHSWRVQDLLYWWDEALCCVVRWKKANMVSMNGGVPPSRCANAIMASQYARPGKTDICSVYIWRTENSAKGDSWC